VRLEVEKLAVSSHIEKLVAFAASNTGRWFVFLPRKAQLGAAPVTGQISRKKNKCDQVSCFIGEGSYSFAFGGTE